MSRFAFASVLSCLALTHAAAATDVAQLGKIFIRAAPLETGVSLDPEVADSVRDLRDRKGDFAIAQDEADADFLLTVLERRVVGKDKFVLAVLSAKLEGKWRPVVKLERDGGTAWGLAARAVMGEAQAWVRNRPLRAPIDPDAVMSGPPANQIFKWLEGKLRPAAAFSVVTRTPAGEQRNETYAIDKLNIEGCAIAFANKTGWNDTAFPPIGYEIAFSAIDVDSIVPREAFIPPGGSASRPTFQILLMAAKPATFVRVIQDRREIVGSASIRIDERRSAHRVANALKAAALLCGAPSTSTTSKQVAGRYNSTFSSGHLDIAAAGAISGIHDGTPIAGSLPPHSGFGTLEILGATKRLWAFAGGVVSEEWDSWSPRQANQEENTTVHLPNAGAAAPPTTVPPALTNADIERLVAAGLSSAIIINSIKQAASAKFDLSLEGLLALKKAGVPDDVVIAMQQWKSPSAPESGAETPSTPVPAPAPKYDSSLKYAPPQTPEQLACAGIDNMGIFKNTALPRAMGGGVVQWLAKVRNNNTSARLITVTWLDEYGQPKRAQVQVPAGQISNVELDLSKDRFIAPVKNFQLVACR